MDNLLINSMSRTGTSLLYQLLYGSKFIKFPPYRIQFVCSDPYGFPFNYKKNLKNKNNFVDILLNSTTVPVNILESTDWTNIKIKKVSDIIKLDELKILEKFNYNLADISLLDRAINILNRFFNIKFENEKYFCLHEDHSFVLGGNYLLSNRINKILTTIRNPVDMIASKKNMLIYHYFDKNDPLKVELADEVIEKEIIRALFSWVVSSYEYSNNIGFPVLFESLKNDSKKLVLEKICEYLSIPYENIMKSDKNKLNLNGNELLFTGSSLKQVSNNKYNTTVGTSKITLQSSEIEKINQLVDLSPIKDLLNADVSDFYKNFKSLWKYYDNPKLPELNYWFNLYKQGKSEKVFKKYSSYNYGKSNSDQAFKINQCT